MSKVLRDSNNVGQASSLSLSRSRQAGSLFYIMAGLIAALSLTACSPQKKEPNAPQDKPLASYQTNLLQTAFDVATAMPVNPHIKDRSKAQATVVDACFQLDQPQLALSYIEKIGNWRRGAGYADYAFYCAQNGFANDVQKYLNLAEQISLVADQDWRRDRIRVRIAQTHRLLGHSEQAESFASNLEKCETGKAEQTEATLCMTDDFQRQMDGLEQMIASADFDQTKNLLYAMAELFSRFYTDVDKRTEAEEKIKSCWRPMPLFVRIELLEKMAGFAIGQDDLPKALQLVNEGRAIIDGAVWLVQYQIPLTARLAALRFRAGDPETARESLLNALELFESRQSEIINMEKTDALLPVAEAFQVMGDHAIALNVYKKIVEAAVENPNSRPRAEDLSAICLSMALSKVEPDEALWNRIQEIQSNLGDPW